MANSIVLTRNKLSWIARMKNKLVPARGLKRVASFLQTASYRQAEVRGLSNLGRDIHMRILKGKML